MGFANMFALKTVGFIVSMFLFSLCWDMETRSSHIEASVFIIRLGT